MASVETQVDVETYRECVDFLVREAALLDRNQVREWLDLLDPKITYLVPLRSTRERSAGPGFSTRGFHMKEDFLSLETRVRRLETEYAWAEDPPSRMRHFVSNFQIEPGERDDEVAATSYLLVYRGRYDLTDFDLISAERQDVLRRTNGGFKLLKRTVLLDHTTLPTHNLAFFF